ncbi:MAG TPA: hypothetical protein VK762_30760 [Polyangiaceae bacterium]|nr:hypothetical protein [Polyangiaceae bacterium]
MTAGAAKSRASRDARRWSALRGALACACLCACGRPETAPGGEGASVDGGGATPPPSALGVRPPASDSPQPPTSLASDASAPLATSPTDDASAASAASVARLDAGRPKPPGKGRGAACSQGQCAAGLACCDTGFHGHCGGVAPTPAETQRDPCVVVSTCVPGPCAPMTFPP